MSAGCSQTEDGNLTPRTKAASTANFKRMHWFAPVDHLAIATWIANSEWAALVFCGSVHQIAQCLLVGRSRYCHVGNGAQVSKVESAVVSHAVFPDKTSAVDAECNREFLNRHIMNHMIVGPLQEARINGHKRTEAVFGHTSGKGHGMAFGNTHVEHPVGQSRLHDLH